MAHWSMPRAPATTQVRPWCKSDDRCCSNKWRAIARSTSRDPVTVTNPVRANESSALAEPACNDAASHDFIENDCSPVGFECAHRLLFRLFTRTERGWDFVIC